MMTQPIINSLHSKPYDPITFVDDLESIRIKTLSKLDKNHQSEYGQFFTQPEVARLMASMFSFYKKKISILDPGAGVGSLSAAIIAQSLMNPRKPEEIYLTAFELDAEVIPSLEQTLSACQELCMSLGTKFVYKIVQDDFIENSIQLLLDRDSLFPTEQPSYDYAILNPPYRKINSNSKTKKILKSLEIDTTNLYSAFVWLAIELLHPDGEIVAITPRSFCNGTYFKNFRGFLLSSLTLKRIHLYESRDKAFKDSDVLQENIIFHGIKQRNRKESVVISSNDNPHDVDIHSRVVEYNNLIDPYDRNFFIRLSPNYLGSQITSRVNQLPCTLQDLGISVSTGKVVDFRSKDFIAYKPEGEIIPLLYSHNIVNGFIYWPNTTTRKPEYLLSKFGIDKLVIPNSYYVLIRRFSSKEEKRRIFAGFFDPNNIHCKRIGIENHLNFIHSKYGELPRDFVLGLTVFLNSTLVDEFFRQFSGHTQVNAADLSSLKYPSKNQLVLLGQNIKEEFPNQDGIDDLVNKILSTNIEDDMKNDPIQAKKRINEAINILHEINVPKSQQNNRSALTLLSLSNLGPSNSWKDVSEHLVGITEMMDFFRDNYGVDYAPNSRETVRKQTIHQFLQMGIVLANPDNPSRPINSPKTKYKLTNEMITLLRSYDSPNWKEKMRKFIETNPNLQNLQLRERPMVMIPVKLPDGSNILLTSGGQNELIKQILEDFCPRFTPGGKIVYLGDAGEKITEKELDYFKDLGILIDRHGKMPDVIIELTDKKWLVIIEAVTSHGPIDVKRHNELKTLFGNSSYGLVFITAFESRKIMNKYLAEIDWETDVWVADSPSHLIHFNGDRFLGPYSS